MNVKNKALLYLIMAALLCFGCNVCRNKHADNSVEYIGITGRTEEETELIKRIMAEDNEGFQDFLMEEWEYPHIQRWVAVWGYDFTGDGQDEIIVSKGDVNISAVLSYNYIYDCTGRKMSEFVGGDLSMTQILNGWKGDGTFLLYDAVHYDSHNNANIYTEIKKANESMKAGVLLLEFDSRPGGEEGEEGYYIFRDFTKEEEIKKVAFSPLEWKNIVRLNSDGGSHFTAVDRDGNYYALDTEQEVVREGIEAEAYYDKTADSSKCHGKEQLTDQAAN